MDGTNDLGSLDLNNIKLNIMKLKRMSLKLIISLIFCGLVNWVSAQDCGTDVNCYRIVMAGGIDIIPHPVTNFLTTNTTYEYRIGVVGMLPTISYIQDVTFGVLEEESGLELILPPGMPVDSSDPANFIVLSPNGMDPVPGTYSFEIDAFDGTNAASKRFEVVVDPVAVVMVLDRSGSMGTDIPGTIPSTTRMDMLKTTASLFVDKFDAFSTDVDKQIALTYFNSGVDLVPAPVVSNLTVIDGNADTFTNDIQTLIAGGSTAIGDALIEGGKDKLVIEDSIYKKSIILFTDGEQNTGKQINDDGTEADGIPLNNPPDDDIQIITIGFDGAAMGSTAVNLQNVAMNNQGGASGDLNFTIGSSTDVSPAGDMDIFFDQALESILSGSSPQTVGVIKGLMPAQNLSSQGFEINQGIDKILFELLTWDQESFFNIEKNGILITDTNTNLKTIRGPNSLLAIVDLFENTSGIVSEGTWKISIGSGTGGGKPYQIKAQVDDHRLDYTFEVSADDFKVEDVLEFEANASYDGTPLDDATISALVFKPGEDLGDLLARANVKFDPSSEGDAASVGYQKLLALIQDNPALIDSLQLKENVVSLAHTGNGKYTAQFSDTDVSGAYQIIASISGTSATSGNYQRMVRRTAYLRFADPDPEISTQTYTQLGGNSIQLMYTPMYSVGTKQRFVGPGFANGIAVTGVDISNVVTVDNGDGSYTIDIDVSNGNTNPNVEISISGVEVFEGKASDFDNKGGILDDFKDWLQNTFGISIWIFLLILLLILLIIWIIKKFIK